MRPGDSKLLPCPSPRPAVVDCSTFTRISSGCIHGTRSKTCDYNSQNRAISTWPARRRTNHLGFLALDALALATGRDLRPAPCAGEGRSDALILPDVGLLVVLPLPLPLPLLPCALEEMGTITPDEPPASEDVKDSMPSPNGCRPGPCIDVCPARRW